MLKKLRIRNFKCFNDFSLDLKEFTILTGSNSAGKSTVIQSILLSDSAYKDYEKRIYINDVYGTNLGIASKLLSREGLSTKETEDMLGFMVKILALCYQGYKMNHYLFRKS